MLSIGRHIYTGISRQGRIAQRHLSQDSSKKNAQLLSDDVLKAARQKMAERGFQAAEGKGAESADAAAAVESTNPLVSKVLLGGFLALVGYGSYRLCRELENEPKQISESSLLLKPIHRAHYRIMSVYKGIVDPDTDHLLPDAFPMGHPYFRPYTLVIELYKLLVHSKWSKEEGWSVQKRPYADYFLTYMSQFYEIVVFTNQIPSYAAPILDKLDGNIQSIFYRLYRDSTCYDIMSGEYVKDISIMNRDPRRVIIMDSDPRSYMHTQPENAIETKPWEGDGNDTFLFDIIPFMETLAISGLEDVRPTLQSYKGKDIPKLFKENLARVQAAQQQEYFSKSADSEQGQSSGLIGTILSWFNVEPNKVLFSL
jgi:import inner membrane translocase subunit TIM50